MKKANKNLETFKTPLVIVIHEKRDTNTKHQTSHQVLEMYAVPI